MKRDFGALVASCALALGLVACGGAASGADSAANAASDVASDVTSGSSAVSADVSSGATSDAGSQTIGGDTSSASSPEPSSASSSTDVVLAQGNPQITMGDLGMIHVHEADGGVGADVVIQVTNTGDVPLVMSNPVIRVADPSGNVIVDDSGSSIFTGPSYLRVGDVGFIYTNKPLLLPAGYPVSQDYLAQGSADLKACREVWEYPVSNLSIGDGGLGMPEVTGTVTNDDSETAPLIEVTVVYMDNGDNTLGVATTLVLDLAPGESQDFTIDGLTLPVGCTLAMVSNYDVIATAPKY